MPQRLTRKESQLQTRERLMDAALEVFSRQGYYATSVDEVAAQAGFSKGAVYSNFSSKEDLFLALIDRNFARDVQGYPGIGHFMNEENQPEQGPDFKEIILQNRSWNLLMTEFILYAIRDAANREKLAGRLEQLRGKMEENLALLYIQKGKKPALAVEELPWSIFSLGVGMALQLYIDPDGLPQGLYERSLGHLLK